MTSEPKIIAFAGGVGVLVAAVIIAVIWDDSPARDAADNAPVVTAQSSPPPLRFSSKPVEVAPIAAESVHGDGTWVIGREIKRGTYRTAGSRSCRWARLRWSPGAPWSAISSPPQFGPQAVALGERDVAFATQGCPEWVMDR